MYPVGRMVVLQNHLDPALCVIPLVKPFSGAQLSKSGLRGRDIRLIGPQAQKVCTIRVGIDVGVRHIWPYYYSNPQLGATIAPYLCPCQ